MTVKTLTAHTGFAAFAALLAFESAGRLASQSVLIDFDEDPDGQPVANGTVVNSLYEVLGVRFEHVGPGASCGEGPEVFASQNCLVLGPVSPPNVVTLCGVDTCSDISEAGFGLIRASCEQLAAWVCIDVVPVGAEHSGVLRAYDAAGLLVGEIASRPGTAEKLCVTFPGISSATFGGHDTRYAWFDNLEVSFSPTPLRPFLRGDANADGTLNIADAIAVLNYLFRGGPAPGCLAASNANGEGEVDIADPTYLLSYLFRGGPAPVVPFPACAASALDTDANLGCGESSCR